ncbi:hypothetical protein [Streptomyces dysideae]|uniref:hypothetical protein n=1 Tax=Streptomyces dysideae TaxID=909626 RepID=UPI000A6ABDC9|nr:hypothetical protein [Streptomyces dysideae]
MELTALVRAAVADGEAELRTAGLTVRTRTGSAPLAVYADADRLHHALGNLLSNTARHCRPGDTVTVTASATTGEALVEGGPTPVRVSPPMGSPMSSTGCGAAPAPA